ncbi:MAG: xanthine dehydrogenase family protein subunit M [Gammaproteobacteria bacterium]|nr:xanthine dehydrogenase family protein subunit M [Gammaproteobacteria bacterium]
MRPARFEYADPRTVAEAVSLLARWGDEAKVLAGGLSLVSMMKLRLLAPTHIVDLRNVPGCAGIEATGDGGLSVGALATYRTLETSAPARSRCPMLAATAAGIGDPQVRNRGTIGGNLCHADPAGDFPPVILALGAELTAVSAQGERRIQARSFFRDFFTTALEPGELLTAITIPPLPAHTGQCYRKLQSRSGAPTLVSAAAVVTLADDGACAAVSLVLGAVGATPVRAARAEGALRGQRLSAELIDEACHLIAGEIEPISDFRASAQYRRDMAAVIAGRALTRALDAARDTQR